MEKRPLVIIHGWSDGSSSFRRLSRLLQEHLAINPQLIDLADYVSMDDDITFDDVVTAMNRAWKRKRLSENPASVDVVVHSTGGLIVRDWISRYFKPDTAPVKHLVMLAPANFGSQLAHRGRAFYGRIIKGFEGRKLFHVGAKLLKGLELASPYSWQLAMKDRFSGLNYYGPGKVLCTVLIGNTGYRGISAAANENGSDGTVRVSCANMNCSYLEANFSNDPLKPTFQFKKSTGITAFGIMDGDNHSTIAAKENGPKNKETIENIVKALQVSDDNFLEWCQSLEEATTKMVEENINDPTKHGYQNTVVFLHDHFDDHIQDYFLEFYDDQIKKLWFEEMFYREVIHSVHAFEDDKSYRSLYINCTRLYQHLHRPWTNLHISLTAVPEFQKNRNIVGYRTFTSDDIGAITIPKGQIDKLLLPHRTMLIRIILRREQADEVFRISNT